MSFENDLQVVFIELNSKCNLSCLYCSREEITNREKGYLPIKNLDWIMERLPKKDLTICPYLSGETLLYPYFQEAIRIIENSGYKKIRLHTNGVVSEEILLKLTLTGISDIIFSVDGVDKADYERIRNTSFEKVKNNIIYLFEMLNKFDRTMNIGIQNLIPKGQPLELNKDLKDIEHLFNEKIIVHPHSWVKNNLPDRVNPNLDEIPCFFLKYYMVISSNGNYLPCCCCLNEEMILGNIKYKTPKQIWYNEMQYLRDRQIAGDRIELCFNCERYNKK